ncbi:MAG: cysteine peptidase family C39 domain-containing protein, partial [Prevotella histicola]
MAGFVFIKQHDAMQCGAACLAMLCHFYGKKYSLQQISKGLESSKGGVSMYDI